MHLLLEHKFLFVTAILYTIALTFGLLMHPIQIVDSPISNMDKLLHVGAYLGLTLLWIFWMLSRQFNKKRTAPKLLWKMILWIVVIAILYGVLMEILQGTLTSYRTPDPWDILANTIGSILALIVSLIFINKMKMLKPKF